jgi:hypothetical protein
MESMESSPIINIDIVKIDRPTDSWFLHLSVGPQLHGHLVNATKFCLNKVVVFILVSKRLGGLRGGGGDRIIEALVCR